VEGDIRIVICDDHPLFREGLRSALEMEDGIEIVGEAGNSEDALKVAEETLPDLILMDVGLSPNTGIEAARSIKEAIPSVKILMLTGSEDQSDLFDSIKTGAAGYLLKGVESQEISRAIKDTIAGQSVVPATMAGRLLQEFANLAGGRDRKQKTGSPLSARELEVLQLLAKGSSNKAVAAELEISETTVKKHVQNILEILQLKSRLEAVMYAARKGIIEIKPD